MADNYQEAQQQFAPLAPMLNLSDPKASLAWFEKLGFANLGVMEMPDGSIGHAMVGRGMVQFMLGPAFDGRYGAPGVTFYITLQESVDGFYARTLAAGIAAEGAPTDQFWGDRTFAVVHPDGYRFEFAEHTRDVSEQEMKDAMAQMVGAGA